MRKTALALLLFAFGCGGTAAKYTVDDVALAQIPVAEKQAIFNAQNGVAVAKSEQQKAVADAQATDNDLDIAKAEKEQARLETSKAKLEVEAAEKSHDQNKIDAAAKMKLAAESGEKAAEAKVDWLSQVKKWHYAVADAAQSQVGLANAKVELEKAKLAEVNKIKPSADFQLQTFTDEYQRREAKAADTRRDADAAKAECDKKEQDYNQLKQQYAQQKGTAATPGATHP